MALGGTLDQQQPNSANAWNAIHASQSSSQTFTAGISGGLDQVDLFLDASSPPTDPLTVEIRDAASGVPSSTVLARNSLPTTAVSATRLFVPITFAPPAPVVAGGKYAIVAYSSTPPANPYNWFIGQPPGLYAAGDSFQTNTSPPSSVWNQDVSGYDLAFLTFVAPKPAAATGQRAAALAKCKKKHGKKTKKKCKKKARLLPI